ncbi:hypothetical protein [Acaryochloris marina]|nr:hypothetical protein [Acaryochloris marina]
MGSPAVRRDQRGKRLKDRIEVTPAKRPKNQGRFPSNLPGVNGR